MRIIRDYKNCPEIAKGSVVALGNFDGVHNGHACVIRTAMDIASAGNKQASVLTFEPHPLYVLIQKPRPFHLTNEGQKSLTISKLGVDNLFIIEFSKAFSELTAVDFVKQVLVDELAVAHVVTGENFIFGNGRGGNPILMKELANEYNFGYTVVSPIGDDAGVFSSSAIRKNITEGKLDKAKEILGRNFAIEGIVQQGDKAGREIGFPTINISLGKYLRPKFGVYAAKVAIEGQEKEFYGAANIGVRPTLDGTKELLEVHIFDFSGDIYGKTAKIELIKYIRPEQKFSGIDALKLQITDDCANIRDFFNNSNKNTTGA